MQNEGGAIPAGMKPWAGGDGPPADWDGGPVWIRMGELDRDPVNDGPSDSQWNHDGWASRLDVVAYTPLAAVPRPETAGAHGLGPNATILEDGADGFEPVALLVGHGTVYLQQSDAQVFLGFKQARDLSAVLAALGQQGAAS